MRFFGAKSWNNIPVDIKRSSSAFSFCQKLRAFLFMKSIKVDPKVVNIVLVT